MPTKYILDAEKIKLNAYRLLCMFYANKEIAKTTDPDVLIEGVAKLEDKFFFSELSKLLIDIAISIRILDDQMKYLPSDSESRIAYDQAMSAANEHHCMMFEEMTLRQVCNKIIHADIVEPHLEESASGNHQIDHYNWLGWSDAIEHSGVSTIPEPEPIKWRHLTNNIRLVGQYKGKEWFKLLEVPIFAEAISKLLDKS